MIFNGPSKIETKQNNIIHCDTCGYEGEISTYTPSMSIYSDIRCPECESTNNKHNSEYMDKLNEAMRDEK